ncbi:putative urea ABC transporter substrate-binding protein [Pacificibacter sp.]|uniref:putative urea ABC transporter substrate-binding protein n=1 Tax=Pacificibacter sp. TaxID=1917866 RepID=UPI003218F21C
MTLKNILSATALSAGLVSALAAPLAAEEKTDFKLAWSIYVGWMPWGYLEDSGIMNKWADKYGITVDIVQINDYVESINQYTAGAFDGVSATNMDTLSIPSGGGVDTTALIIGDYSNGNDAVILKGEGGLADLKGKPVNLVELSVSHYLLARGLETVGLEEADLDAVINTSDADMIAAYATSDVEAVVTWNPLVSEITGSNPDANVLFDSSMFPGEILDLMVVNTETLADNPAFGKAVAGAWYEVMGLMAAGDDGRYSFTTVKPVEYTVPSDGPVGDILRACGRHPWRPSHLHYIVKAPGYRTLVTEIFPEDDPYLDQDTVFGVRDDLVMRYHKKQASDFPHGMALSGKVTEPFLHVEFDVTLATETG